MACRSTCAAAFDSAKPIAINVIDFGSDPDRATWEAVAQTSGGSYQNLSTSTSPELDVGDHDVPGLAGWVEEAQRSLGERVGDLHLRIAAPRMPSRGILTRSPR